MASNKTKKKDENICVRTVAVNTPYVTVEVSSDDISENMDYLVEKAEQLLNKYSISKNENKDVV